MIWLGNKGYGKIADNHLNLAYFWFYILLRLSTYCRKYVYSGDDLLHCSPRIKVCSCQSTEVRG